MDVLLPGPKFNPLVPRPVVPNAGAVLVVPNDAVLATPRKKLSIMYYIAKATIKILTNIGPTKIYIMKKQISKVYSHMHGINTQCNAHKGNVIKVYPGWHNIWKLTAWSEIYN